MAIRVNSRKYNTSVLINSIIKNWRSKLQIYILFLGIDTLSIGVHEVHAMYIAADQKEHGFS